MKKISQWLLAGSLLAVAFACRSKQSEDDQSDQSQYDGCSEESAHQTSVLTPISNGEKDFASTPQITEEGEGVALQSIGEQQAIVEPALVETEQNVTLAVPPSSEITAILSPTPSPILTTIPEKDETATGSIHLKDYGPTISEFEIPEHCSENSE